MSQTSNCHELLSSKGKRETETFKFVHEVSDFIKFGPSQFNVWSRPKILCKFPTFLYTTTKVKNLSKLPEKVY